MLVFGHVCSCVHRLDDFKRFATLGRHYGIESRMLTASESKEVHPFLNTTGILGSLYSPGDGTIEPSGIVAAYVKGARLYGAKVQHYSCSFVLICMQWQIYENTSVTGIEIKDGQVSGVKTSRGGIKTKKVVNCAGAWGRKLGALAGVKVPLVAMRHAYVVTEPVKGIHGVPNMRDHEAAVYIKRQVSCQLAATDLSMLFLGRVIPSRRV